MEKTRLLKTGGALFLLFCLLCLLPGKSIAEPPTEIDFNAEQITCPEGGLTNEKAAEGYINRTMHISSDDGLRRRSETVSMLSESEKKLYYLLKTEIQKVALGQRGSTRFTFPIGSVLDNTSYTAEDLGVSRLREEDGSVYYWALYAFYDRIMPQVGKVMHALMTDCPFDLFWFDKTLDSATQTGGVRWYYVDYVLEGDTIRADATKDFIVCFTVAKEYSATGTKGTFEFDVSCALAAQTAAGNAQTIVENNKNKTDREKLYAYKDAICGLVDYNHAAVENDDTPYGNAWQLIWIFDGDPNTHVVCEGYSKAFQYLCDLSAFTEGTACVSVHGYVWLSNGNEGRHMWNLVTYGGNRYLADVTNCDEGTIGYPGKLFLKGYTSKTEGSYPTYSYDVDGVEIYYQYDSAVTGLMPAEELSVEDDPLGVDDGDCTAGTCGENLTWRMSSDGVLRISGSGEITEYGTGEHAWWDKSKVKKIILTDGVTGIGKQAFTDCQHLKKICLVSGITAIAEDAFSPRDMQATVDKRTFDIPGCTDTYLINWAREHYYNYTYKHLKQVYDPQEDPTCTEAGHTSSMRCDACGTVLNLAEEILPLGHDWQAPTYSWSGDNSAVTAKRECARDASHREEETAQTTMTTVHATVSSAGKITYRAEFRNSAFAPQVREIVLPALPAETDPQTEQPDQSQPENPPDQTQPENPPDQTQPENPPDGAEHETETESETEKYTVRWQNADGTILETNTEVAKGSVPVYHGETPFKAADAEQSWVFSGWDPPVAEVFSDITYTAQFTAQKHRFIMKLPAGSREIGKEAFEGCAFEAVIIPAGCTKIGARAFANCLNLVYIRIPASVRSIAADAFEGCGPLTVDRGGN